MPESKMSEVDLQTIITRILDNLEQASPTQKRSIMRKLILMLPTETLHMLLFAIDMTPVQKEQKEESNE